MSGPIVRKYGFPNFDNIFGKRELEHGVEDKDQRATPAAASSESTSEPNSAKPVPAPSVSKTNKSS